jgi:hypothetical protein
MTANTVPSCLCIRGSAVDSSKTENARQKEIIGFTFSWVHTKNNKDHVRQRLSFVSSVHSSEQATPAVGPRHF